MCTAPPMYIAFHMPTKMKLFQAHFSDTPFKVIYLFIFFASVLFVLTGFAASSSCDTKQLLLIVFPNVLRTGFCSLSKPWVRSNKDKLREGGFSKLFHTAEIMAIHGGWDFWGESLQFILPAPLAAKIQFSHLLWSQSCCILRFCRAGEKEIETVQFKTLQNVFSLRLRYFSWVSTFGIVVVSLWMISIDLKKSILTICLARFLISFIEMIFGGPYSIILEVFLLT